MINVSTQLKKESLTNRNYYVTANVTLSNGTTLKLGKKDFYLSGNSLVDSADSGDFPVGVAIEKTASLSLVNDDGRFDGYNFNAARFVIFLNVQLSDRIETIKRGTYIVSKKPATASEISLSLLDKMHNTDKAYDSNLSFPCTVKELLSECCQQCGITLGDAMFPNADFQIQKVSSTTYRTVIGMCAGIAGGNARIDENDLLRIITFDKTFTNTTIYDGGAVKNWTNGDDLDGGTLNPWTTGAVVDGGTLNNNDYHALFSIQNLQYDVDDVIVTGIKYVEDETEYMSGQDGYVITIDNQLLSGNAQAGVEAIGNQLIGLRMRPFSCDGIANGYATFGDPVEFIDTKNRVFRSFATNVEFVFGGSTSWSCSAKSAEEDASEFIGEQQAAVEQSKKDIEKKLSAYDVKLKQMNELAANTLGFFYTEVIQEDGSVIAYRHDKPTLVDSKVIYKTGVDGFFLSVDGGQTWKAGFDSNGDAVLNILYAIGIQSEWINTRGFTAKDNDGNVTLRIDADTGAVTLEVESFTLKSRTIEQIAKDVANETVQNNVTVPNYYGTYTPTLQNYPASEWKSEEYKKHDGSIFMNFSTSRVYMFSGADGVWQELDTEKIVNFETVFNALTDNGKQEGIYIQDGHLYVNASYIKSGQISADLINLKNINVTNSSGTSTFAIDNYGNVTLRPNTFALTNGDTIYSVAEDKASTALSSANRYTDNALGNLDIGKMSKQEIINVLSDNSSNKGLYLSNGNVYMNADYINTGELAGWKVGYKKLSARGTYGEVTLDASAGEIYSETNTGVYVPGYGTLYGTRIRGINLYTGTVHASSVSVNTSVSADSVLASKKVKAGTHVEASGHFYSVGTGTDLADASIRGKLKVSGTKSRSVSTIDYDEQLFYCYEMPTPFFGDIGESVISDDGTCMIDIDDIFQESANVGIKYYVFLQREGEGDCWIAEKEQNYFIVKGTPGLKFSFEIKARQVEYEHMRFTDPGDTAYTDARDIEIPEPNYESEEAEVLEPDYESELINDRLSIINQMEVIS